MKEFAQPPADVPFEDIDPSIEGDPGTAPAPIFIGRVDPTCNCAVGLLCPTPILPLT